MALNELAIVSSRIAGLRMFPALFSIVSLPSGVWLALGWTHHSTISTRPTRRDVSQPHSLFGSLLDFTSHSKVLDLISPLTATATVSVPFTRSYLESRKWVG